MRVCEQKTENISLRDEEAKIDSSIVLFQSEGNDPSIAVFELPASKLVTSENDI